MVAPRGPSRAHQALSLACAALLACASQKTKEELAEDRSTEADRLLLQASEAMDRLDPEVAEETLKEARDLLDDPAASHWPDHSFQVQDLSSKEERLVAVRAEVARVRLEKAVTAQTEKVDELVAKLDLALKPLTGRDGAGYTKSQIEEVTDVRSLMVDRLNEGVELEKQSEPYQKLAKKVADRLRELPETIEAANRAVAFNDGPLTASRRARELIEEGELIEGKAELDRCAIGAAEVAKEPSLAKVMFDDGGKKETPRSLAKSCQTRAKSLKAKIAQLERKAKQEAKREAAAKAKAERAAERAAQRAKKKK